MRHLIVEYGSLATMPSHLRAPMILPIALRSLTALSMKSAMCDLEAEGG
ncbi:MAG: hypothetical protein ACRD2P_16685 [Terriglobia bacterium]